MNHRKLKLFLLAVILALSPEIYGQELNKTGTISISVNIFKLFMGMPNLELAYNISPDVSIYIFNEAPIFGKFFKKNNHPGYVFRTGGRYHFLGNSNTKNDLHGGLYCGFTKSKNYIKNKYFLGIDAGYRYRFKDTYYVFPRTLITYSPHNSHVLPGFEVLLGKVNN